MADKAITDLPEGGPITGVEQIHALQAANSRFFTFSTLRQWIAGVVNDFTKNQVSTDVALIDADTVSIDAQAAHCLTLITTRNPVLANPSNMPGDGKSSNFIIEVTASGAQRTPTVGSYYQFYSPVEIPAGKRLTIFCMARGTDRIIVTGQKLED